MRFTIPKSDSELPDDYFLFIVAKMCKAGWLRSGLESGRVLNVDYTDLGRSRMRRLSKLAVPFADTQRITSISSRLRHDVLLLWAELRCVVIAWDLKLSLLSGDVPKLLILAAMYSEPGGSGYSMFGNRIQDSPDTTGRRFRFSS